MRRRAIFALDLFLGLVVVSNCLASRMAGMHTAHPLLVALLFGVYAWAHARNRVSLILAGGMAAVSVVRYVWG